MNSVPTRCCPQGQALLEAREPEQAQAPETDSTTATAAAPAEGLGLPEQLLRASEILSSVGAQSSTLPCATSCRNWPNELNSEAASRLCNDDIAPSSACGGVNFCCCFFNMLVAQSKLPKKCCPNKGACVCDRERNKKFIIPNYKLNHVTGAMTHLKQVHHYNVNCTHEYTFTSLTFYAMTHLY